MATGSQTWLRRRNALSREPTQSVTPLQARNGVTLLVFKPPRLFAGRAESRARGASRPTIHLRFQFDALTPITRMSSNNTAPHAHVSSMVPPVDRETGSLQPRRTRQYACRYARGTQRRRASPKSRRETRSTLDAISACSVGPYADKCGSANGEPENCARLHGVFPF